MYEGNKEYIVVCESKKHTFMRHKTIDRAIGEANRLAGLTGHKFTVCKVKGTVEPPTGRAIEVKPEDKAVGQKPKKLKLPNKLKVLSVELKNVPPELINELSREAQALANPKDE